MEMMLDKKLHLAICLLEFKMGCKVADRTCNIDDIFGPGTANEPIMQWWFKKFCKGDKSLEDEECNGWPSEVDTNRLRAIIHPDDCRKLILLQLHKKLPQIQH